MSSGGWRGRWATSDIFRSTREHWRLADAVAFADLLIVDACLEAEAIGIEVLALHRPSFTPRLLSTLKAWLARGDASNWATTDAICGSLIGPLIVAHPELAGRLRGWARHRSLWVRRASVVGLIPPIRKGQGLDVLYDNARALEPDPEDLIHKAVGWALREAGKVDRARLERHLRDRGPSMPRTTVRYAMERFDEPRRRALLRVID